MMEQKLRKRQDGNTGGQFSALWSSSSELCHCCIPEIPNASSSLLLPQKSERDNHRWTARALEQEDLHSSEHLCPYKQAGSDVFTTQELFYGAENEASKALTSTDPQIPKVFQCTFGFWLNEGSSWHLLDVCGSSGDWALRLYLRNQSKGPVLTVQSFIRLFNTWYFVY